MKCLIILLSILFSFDSFSKKIALSIMGSSRASQDFTNHEFAWNTLATAEGLKAKGYEVHSIFSEIGLDRSGVISEDAFDIRDQNTESNLFAKDYAEVKKRFPDSKPATKKNIIEKLRLIGGQLNEGDTFTLNYNAHGHCICKNKDNPESAEIECTAETDYDPNCHHEVDIFNEDGTHTRMKTKDIIDELRKIEDKGVKINFMANSCFSGLLKKEVRDLKNTCSFILASGSAVGYACFDSDPPDSPDITSTAGSMQYLMYSEIQSQLLADPYFNKSNCFNKTNEHAQRIGLTGSDTITSAFWKARNTDRSFGEPSLSSLLDLSYFSKGPLTEKFMYRTEAICAEAIEQDLNKIESVLDEMTAPLFKQSADAYKREIEKYNQNIRQQKALRTSLGAIRPDEPQFRVRLQELHELQAKTEELARKVIQAERQVTSFFQGLINEENDNCNRTF